MRERLGQYFLKNPGAIQKIISSLDLKHGEVIIEIGPGTGALTIPLADACAKIDANLIAIEKDELLLQELTANHRFAPKNFQAIAGDALKIIPEIIDMSYGPHKTYRTYQTYKIVGNIPYYITGKLLRIVSELAPKPAGMTLTLQREVAERICAEPPRMNLLAASVQIWAEPKIISILKPADFTPSPEVYSAIIHFKTLAEQIQPIDFEKYYRFIRTAFKQPRKLLINNIAAGFSLKKPEINRLLEKVGVSPEGRAQSLKIATLLALSRAFC